MWLLADDYSYWASRIERRPRNSKSLSRDHSTCIEYYCLELLKNKWRVLLSNWNFQWKLRKSSKLDLARLYDKIVVQINSVTIFLPLCACVTSKSHKMDWKTDFYRHANSKAHTNYFPFSLPHSLTALFAHWLKAFMHVHLPLPPPPPAMDYSPFLISFGSSLFSAQLTETKSSL